jgi:hypothetical protein
MASGKIQIGQIDAAFIPEEDWWRKALFVKIIRGDAGDGIFSAFPRVHADSKTKPSINAAWEDRHTRGYNWNNFMLSEWNKLVRTDDDGTIVTKMVRVIDEFQFNEQLIDLTKQPEEIIGLMDGAINEVMAMPLVEQTGFHFLQFCARLDLPALAKEVYEHGVYLQATYPNG